MEQESSSQLPKVDAYNIDDYRTPRQRHMLNMAHQYKRFDLTDIYIILGVFLIGFVFAMVLSNYYKFRKEKIQQINQKFQSLKGEYEHLQKKMGSYIAWKYRVKFAEKVYYIGLLSLGFMFYKSPSLLNYTFVEIPHFSIPFFAVSILAFHLVTLYLDRKKKDVEHKHKKLKDQLKDTKRLLISHMDPLMVQTVKEIIRKDMRKEIEQMKNSDEGCSVKCRLTNQMLTKDLDRNKQIVQELITFKFCDTCKNPQPGAVQVCHSGCGQKVFKKCLPLMREFGEREAEIQRLRNEIREITSQTLKFTEYQKAKRELEFEEQKKSSTYSRIDLPSIRDVNTISHNSNDI